MNIIENRQKILIERLQCENDFNQFFPINIDEGDTDKHDDS